MKVVFRVDASLEIGSGHVMRCLTLAHALRARRAKCLFICREHIGNLAALIRQQGFEVADLTTSGESVPFEADSPAHAAWVGADWQQDAAQTLGAIGEEYADLLVVDHYGLDARWERTLRAGVMKILVIDDLADRQHDCDLLLDQNLVANLNSRYDGLLPAACARLQGPQYALLQPQYKELHDRIPPREREVRRLLAYFGAADSENLSSLVVEAFIAIAREDITLDLVINSASVHAGALRAQVRGSRHITLHENLPSLAQLMVHADLAIGAGGATSWERCCLGLPALVITVANNQKEIAAELHRQQYIEWLGHKDAVDRQTLQARMVELLNHGLVEGWSEHCLGLVDGRGVDRVVDMLLLAPGAHLVSRLARWSDEAQVVQCVGPIDRRRGLVANALRATSDCRDWFRSTLRNHGQIYHYMVETATGVLVGQVIFTRDGGGFRFQVVMANGVLQTDAIRRQVLQCALSTWREGYAGALQLFPEQQPQRGFQDDQASRAMHIGICSDAGSWINLSIAELVIDLLGNGHTVAWAHSAAELPNGELCFYLSYSRIVNAQLRMRHRHNLVVHESDLPIGRGWAPMSWQILEGENEITVTLLEAEEDVDAGVIYLQEKIQLNGCELNSDWRRLQAKCTLKLCRQFVQTYPLVIEKARQQVGLATFYSRRRACDSRLDPMKSIQEQFNLLRIVHNKNYPAFFELNNVRYVVHIEKDASK